MKLQALSELFKSVGDPARLRLLHLLAVEELTVGELVRIVEMPQSSVSRHLKVLRDQGLLSDRSVGPTTYYRALLEADLGNGETAVRDALMHLMTGTELPPGDRRRLDRVVAQRSGEGEEFFDKIGLQWDALREECFGPTFHLEAFISLLPNKWTVADLGSGTGYLLPVLGRHFARVIAIDSSKSMLDVARRRLHDEKVSGVKLRHGDLEKLPLDDAEVDLAVVFLMLHHLADVASALREVRRVLKPAGQALIVEMHEHENELFRSRMADRRSGVSQKQLSAWLKESGFHDARFWDLPYSDRPEHELSPLPRLYGCVARVN